MSGRTVEQRIDGEGRCLLAAVAVAVCDASGLDDAHPAGGMKDIAQAEGAAVLHQHEGRSRVALAWKRVKGDKEKKKRRRQSRRDQLNEAMLVGATMRA